MIDQLMAGTIDELNAGKSKVTCRSGCGYCCYLLVEISWEEASELAHWIHKQPKAKREEWIQRIKQHAARARKFFKSHKHGKNFVAPSDEHEDVPDDLFADYADEVNKPCPFLVKNKCVAYLHRPTPCRLHVVTTPPEICSHCHEDEEQDIKVPRKIVSLQKTVGDLMDKLYKDQRWGQMSIMVESVLKSISKK